MLVGGESITAAKRKAIEAVGAECLPMFGCTETGESAEGCLSPASADDMHVYEHKFALVSRTMQTAWGEELETPLFTTLDPETPKFLLNGDTGDVAIVEQRDCGCPWGELGYRTHLRDVWSYSKLTAEGMTLPGEAIFEVLERVLPAQFGGRSGDYQLVSEPSDNGITRYLLFVNPSLGPLDKDAVGEAFRESLSKGSYRYRYMTEFLRQAGHLDVIRRPPIVQPGGKSLPVMLQRRTSETLRLRNSS
jgi:hypothetical protein